MNYKIEKTYWLVNYKDYDCLISASNFHFKKENIEYFKIKYPVNLFFSYDNHFNFCCAPISDIDFFYDKKYKYMGNFSLKDERKDKLKKIHERSRKIILEST